MNSLRKAVKTDVPFIKEMIKELAIYEKAEEQATITEKELLHDGFELNPPLFESFILEYNGKPCGFALYYYRYSTWKGKSLYLEDLYIQAKFRGKGLGKLAMQTLAQTALETNSARFEWQVLDWNAPSIKFYESIHASLDSEWINCRLTGDSLFSFYQKKQ